jgi:hypothetical protein
MNLPSTILLFEVHITLGFKSEVFAFIFYGLESAIVYRNDYDSNAKSNDISGVAISI